MSILDKFRLDNKVAIITGAGRGIGCAIAKIFAQAGADVVLAARTMSELRSTEQAVKAFGNQCLVLQTDVLNEDQLQNLSDQTVKHFGKIDILVNNAGGFPPKPALKTSTQELEHAFKFNVSTAFALTRRCAPIMVQSGSGGCVINIASVAGLFPSPGIAAYGTAKSALCFLTQELAQDFAPQIRVNALAVGSTRTQALDTILNAELEETMTSLTPMARLGEVDDIALSALFLASPASSYITGEIINISGGLTRLNVDLPRAWKQDQVVE